MYSFAASTASVPRDPQQATNPSTKLPGIPRPDPSASTEPRQAMPQVTRLPPPPIPAFPRAPPSSSLPRSAKLGKLPKRTGVGKPSKPSRPSTSAPADSLSELGTYLREIPPIKSSIAIPISAAPPSSVYRRGCGPPVVKPTLVPPHDSTAYIISRYEVPSRAVSKIDGRLMPPELVFLVGWTDLPAAYVTVPIRNLLDYVSPYKYEEWEAEEAHKRRGVRQEVERARAEADADLSRESETDPLMGGTVAKKKGRLRKMSVSERTLAHYDDNDEEDELAGGYGNAQEPTVVSLSQMSNVPSLSTPRKPLLQAAMQQDSDAEMDDEGRDVSCDDDDDDDGVEVSPPTQRQQQQHSGSKMAGLDALGLEHSHGDAVKNRFSLVSNPQSRHQPSLMAPPPVSSSVSSSSVLSDPEPRSTSITPRVGSPGRYPRRRRLDRGWSAMKVPSTLRNGYSAARRQGSKRDRASNESQTRDYSPYAPSDAKSITSAPMARSNQGVAGSAETHASKRRRTEAGSQQPQDTAPQSQPRPSTRPPPKETVAPVSDYLVSFRAPPEKTNTPPPALPGPSPAPIGTPLQDTSADASAEDDGDQRDLTEWVVDRLEAVKRAKHHGRLQLFFLVRWEGFSDPTWEPEHHISRDLVDKFYASHPDIKDLRKKRHKQKIPWTRKTRPPSLAISAASTSAPSSTTGGSAHIKSKPRDKKAWASAPRGTGTGTGTAGSGPPKKGLQQSRLSFPLLNVKKYHSVLDVMGDDEHFEAEQNEEEDMGDGDDMEEVLLL